MADKGNELKYYALDALVKDFLRAYKSLGREGKKPTQEAPDRNLAGTLHVDINAPLVTTQRAMLSQKHIPQPMTPRFQELETMVVDRVKPKLPHASRASTPSTPRAFTCREPIPKPLTSHFEEVEANIAGHLERELPSLLEDDGGNLGTLTASLTGDSGTRTVSLPVGETRTVSLHPDVSENSVSRTASCRLADSGDFVTRTSSLRGICMSQQTSVLSAFSALTQESVPKQHCSLTAISTKSLYLQSLIRRADQSLVHYPTMASASPLKRRQRRCAGYIKQCWQWCNDTPKTEMVAQNLDPVMCVVIIINCILTALSFDTDEWGGWYFIECVFAGLFILEICVKVALVGWREVYLGPSRAWSMFDTLIAIIAIVDLFSRFSGAVTTLRVLRLLRFVRILRLARLPLLKEMNMLVRGMIGGARCLVWCIIFLSLPILLIGMVLSQELKDWGDELFSSVPASMFTALRCMCGDCTDKHGRPLFLLIASKRGWAFALFYSIFVLVTTFGVLNLITAFYIETTMLATKSDSVLQKQIREAEDRKFAKNIKKLIFCFWIAHSDSLVPSQIQSKRTSVGQSKRIRNSYDTKEFRNFVLEDALDLSIDEDFYQQQVKTPDIREVLDDMGLPDEDIVDLFDMLDVDRSGTLDLTELVTGLYKLRGDARKHDLVGLVYIIYSAQERILREIQKCVGSPCDAHGGAQGD